MVPLDKFLACVQENAARVREYAHGGDGSNGKCDCIGLIIGALKLAGFTWPGTHGSNWAARNAMATPPGLCPISPDRGGVFLGEIVYKVRMQGEEKYDLPDHYNGSGDLLDYYHVGVVTGVDPLEITHCTSVAGGIKRDNTLGQWRYGGKLKYVDYASPSEKGAPEEGREVSQSDGEVLPPRTGEVSQSNGGVLPPRTGEVGRSPGGVEEPMEGLRAMAYANSGKTENLRQGPDKKSALIARVPIGEEVRILETHTDGSAWNKVSYGGKTGYIMTKYLLFDHVETEQDGDGVTVPRETLEVWADVLEDMAQDMRELIGQG